MAEYTDAEKTIIRRDLEAGKIAPDLVPKARQVLGITEAPVTAPAAPLKSPIHIDITKGQNAPAASLQTGATMRAATPTEVQAGEEVRRQELAQLPQRHALPPVLSGLPGEEYMSAPELFTMGAALGVNLLTTGGGAALAGVPGAVVGSGVGRAINKRLGLEEPGVVGDVLAYAAPLMPGGVKGAKDLPKTLLRYSRAGRAMTAAEEATQAAREAWATRARELGIKEAAGKSAAGSARMLPGMFAPPIPASNLYAQFSRDFGEFAVVMEDANKAAAGVLNQLGGHFEVLQQPRMQAIATEMLATQNANVTQVHQWLKDLGPMTRRRNVTDPTTRGAARQLYRGLQESLTTVPGASASLKAANTAARKEFALDDLEGLIRRAVSGPSRLPRLNGEGLAKQVRILGDEDQLFRGSFTESEWRTLSANLDALAEASPSGARPPAQYPAYPPAADPRDYLKFPSTGRLAAEVAIAGTEGAMRGHLGPYVAAGLGLATADVAGYGLARLLLTPGMQPILRRMILPSGAIDPRAMVIFSAAARLPWAGGPTSNQRIESTAPEK